MVNIMSNNKNKSKIENHVIINNEAYKLLVKKHEELVLAGFNVSMKSMVSECIINGIDKIMIEKVKIE